MGLVFVSLKTGFAYRFVGLLALQRVHWRTATRELLRRYHAGALSADCFARMCDGFAAAPYVYVPSRYTTRADLPVSWETAKFTIPGGLRANGWRIQLDGLRILTDDRVVLNSGPMPWFSKDLDGSGNGSQEYIKNPSEGKHTIAVEQDYGLYPRGRGDVDMTRPLHRWHLRVARRLLIDPSARPVRILTDRAARDACRRLHVSTEAPGATAPGTVRISWCMGRVPIAGELFARVHSSGEYVDLGEDLALGTWSTGDMNLSINALGLERDWLGSIDLRVVPDEKIASRNLYNSYFGRTIEILNAPVLQEGAANAHVGVKPVIRVREGPESIGDQ